MTRVPGTNTATAGILICLCPCYCSNCERRQLLGVRCNCRYFRLGYRVDGDEWFRKYWRDPAQLTCSNGMQ